MIISKLTDEQLRLAIAKELGWTDIIEYRVHGTYVGPHRNNMYGIAPQYSDGIHRCKLPDWPGDPAAALGLLEEFDNWAIHYSSGADPIMPPDKKKGFSVLIPERDEQEWNLGKYQAENESLPRAICEAWLQARSKNA